MSKPECLWVRWSKDEITAFASYDIALVPTEFVGAQRRFLFQEYLDAIYHPSLIIEAADPSDIVQKMRTGMARALAKCRYQPDVTDYIDGRTE